jgi:hypothetical protein
MNPFVFTFTGAALMAAIGFGALWLNRRDERRERSKSK